MINLREENLPMLQVVPDPDRLTWAILGRSFLRKTACEEQTSLGALWKLPPPWKSQTAGFPQRLGKAFGFPTAPTGPTTGLFKSNEWLLPDHQAEE